MTEMYHGEVEIYTDGSMRYSDSIASAVLHQPKSLRKPIHAQGGLLVHFGKQSSPIDHEHNITITIEEGTTIGLMIPSSTEVYAILLAMRLNGAEWDEGSYIYRLD